MKTNKLKIGLTIAIVSILVMIIILAFTILPEAYKAPIILKGVVITPDEVYDPGWIVVNNRKIESVSPNQINIPGAIEIDTGGIIFPGLINLHDHVVWNVFPRWDPNQVFMNRYEWRMGNEDYVKISAAFSGISADLFCEMNTYGEIRALAGGTTSIVGTANRLCIRGLVRNLDFLSGFYQIPIIQDHAHIRNLIDVPNDIQEIIKFLNADESEALFIHLAEGVGPAMRAEFDQMDEKGLLTDKTAIIHGIALSPDQYRRMNEKGASLIWSPRGNLELYGQTADITSALEADVMVAIGSDWAITGSANILDELRFAAEWNSTNLGNLLNDKQLVEMVTTIPAAIAGISEEVGTISEGKFADLLVISGDPSNPYRSLIDADPESVQLVLVDGIPVFGEILLMERFWDSAELSQVDIGGAIKALRQTEFTDMVYDLKQALSDYDFDLASIAEVVNVEPLELVVAIEQEMTPLVLSGGINWEDAVHFFGENMTVCGPVVEINYADADDQIPSNLNIGLEYADIDRFVVFIPQSARGKFTGFTKDSYLEEVICVTGEILSYQGVAEIVVTDPDQITIP